MLLLLSIALSAETSEFDRYVLTMVLDKCCVCTWHENECLDAVLRLNSQP